jgi:hypothetical protein
MESRSHWKKFAHFMYSGLYPFTYNLYNVDVNLYPSPGGLYYKIVGTFSHDVILIFWGREEAVNLPLPEVLGETSFDSAVFLGFQMMLHL